MHHVSAFHPQNEHSMNTATSVSLTTLCMTRKFGILKWTPFSDFSQLWNGITGIVLLGDFSGLTWVGYSSNPSMSVWLLSNVMT